MGHGSILGTKEKSQQIPRNENVTFSKIVHYKENYKQDCNKNCLTTWEYF